MAADVAADAAADVAKEKTKSILQANKSRNLLVLRFILERPLCSENAHGFIHLQNEHALRCRDIVK